MQKILLYLRLVRVSSWSKNIFVFAPIFFAQAIWRPPNTFAVALAAIAFCCVASTVYVLNDLVDCEQDQKHATKKDRPLASGRISKKMGVAVLVVLTMIDAILLYSLSTHTALILLLYAFLNVLYSFYLKHITIVDILLVASFYVLRVVTGGIAAQVPVSSWLIVATLFLALLLVVGKRKSELGHNEFHRPVMMHYSESFLGAMCTIVASLTVISYSLYILIVHPVPYAVYTIFFVLMGVMQYLLLVMNGHNVESPEKMIWKDRVILISIVCWLVVMYFIFYSSAHI